MILLDFDGVLINSRDEVVVTTYRYLTKSDATKISDLPPFYAEKMRKLRPFAGPAHELIPLAGWCLENRDEEFTEETLHSLCEKSSIEPKERAARFFAARAEFFKKHPQAWYDIHAIYEPFVPTIKKISSHCTILTNKNKVATKTLLDHFDIPIGEERIFSGDNGVTKSENLEKIAALYSQNSFLFFDDHAGVLAEVMDDLPEGITVVPYLALWGFSSPEHTELARERGYKLVDQEEASKIVISYTAQSLR
jgi:FMN phosphatase YigB (HAD superfamily)